MSLEDRPAYTCPRCTFDVGAGASWCPMCEAESPVAPYAVPLEARIMERLSLYMGYPLVTRVEQLERLAEVLEAAEGGSEEEEEGERLEFCLGDSFHPHMVLRCIQLGVFPMSIHFRRLGLDVPAWKLHARRCVLTEIGASFVRPKGATKRSRRFVLSMNTAWERALHMIRSNHSRCWLVPSLERALFYIRDACAESGVRIHCFEVWTAKERRLAAVEIGYSVGSCYTSMTGAFEVSGAGSVQLACTAALLERWGMHCWDFGMEMDYKRTFGATCVPRAQWQQQLAQYAASTQMHVDIPRGFVPCRELLET